MPWDMATRHCTTEWDRWVSVIGNGGDLRTGLAAQSVHGADGFWYHEPLRLQVVVEASRERIDHVLKQQPTVANLVDNHWVRLFALDREGTGAWIRTRGDAWEPVDIPVGSIAHAPAYA